MNPGLKSTSSSSFSAKLGLKSTFGASLAVEDFSASASKEYNMELETAMSQTDEKTWQQTNTITFTAPAGKFYRVLQNTVKFSSPLETDNCELRCNYTIDEQ